jgi:hypothetical protein
VSGAKWCGYCQHSIEGCTCPPWMPNTGTDAQRKERAERQEGRLTPHQLWREKAIWLLDALCDATRELRDSGELDAMLAHLDKHPSLSAGTKESAC